MEYNDVVYLDMGESMSLDEDSPPRRSGRSKRRFTGDNEDDQSTHSPKRTKIVDVVYLSDDEAEDSSHSPMLERSYSHSVRTTSSFSSHRTATHITFTQESFYAAIYTQDARERMFPIYSRDRFRLTGKHLLNDHIINFHLAAMISSLPTSKRNRVSFVNSQSLANFGSPAATLKDGFVRDRHFRDSLFDKDLLLAPVNWDAHWALLAFYNFTCNIDGAATGVVLFVDSLGRTNPLPCDLEHEIGLFVQAQAKRYAEVNKDDVNARDVSWVRLPDIVSHYTSFTRPETSIQASYFECGYYVLQYASTLIKRLDSHKFTAVNRVAEITTCLGHITPVFMEQKIPRIRSIILGEIEQHLV